jgi:hypothetical protein
MTTLPGGREDGYALREDQLDIERDRQGILRQGVTSAGQVLRVAAVNTRSRDPRRMIRRREPNDHAIALADGWVA